MDKNKIIIVGLVIVIVALVAAIAFTLLGNGNNVSDDSSKIPDGMQRYNFDAEFTMLVKDDAKFIKSWDSGSFGVAKNYYNKEDKYAIQFTESVMLKNNEKTFIDTLNSTGDYDISEDGDLKIVKVLDKSEKFSAGNSERHFDYRVVVFHEDLDIILSGNDLDSLKEMANSIEFNLGGNDE